MRIIYLILACIFTLSLSTSVDAQHRNCGATDYLEQQIAVDPDRVAKMEAIEQHTQRFISEGGASQRAVITIPVVVHVVYRTAAENISDAQIQTQIDVLNEDFRRTNSDADNTWPQAADSEIEFCLASVDPNGNATTGITRTSTTVNGFGTNDQVKYTAQGGKDAWPTANYLNFWVCNIGGGILGYAQFPGGPAATDGVVNGYQYTGTIGTAQAPFNLGRTATHEVGHWLNLRHIWGDGNCNADDFVADTPVSDASNGGCATGHVSCGTVDMVQNYMDYSDDACMNLFTQGQKERMQAVLAPGGFRASLLNSPACGGSAEPTCTDGIQNGNETGVDCGGPDCDDCPTCDDGIQNGDETGVDCGGSCDACPSNCTDNDVVVTITLDQYGSETTWTITNANGSVVGSGGPYQNQSNGTQEVTPLCLPDGCYNFTINDSYGDGICCAYGEGSYEVADATGVLISGGEFGSTETAPFCVGGVTGETCDDGIQNGNETGVDCGGDCAPCPTCDDGVQNGSETGVDCGGNDCAPCATCDDGIQNGNETDVDCGGDCAPCATCNDGIQNGDETGVDCGGTDCVPCATCDDGVQNGSEEGVDCGGDCAPCATCDDGIQNGNETGVDCGGNECAPCATCNDGIQNGNETGVDCGGSDCAPCDNGSCTDVTLTLVLDRYGSETAWNFTDANGAVIASGSGYPNNQNGLTITETLCLDDGCYDFNITDSYGDGICCAYGQGSYTITDENGNTLAQGGQFNTSDTAPFCVGGTPPPTCNDGIQNGDEEGVDCGGSNCAPCQADPTCDDGIQNGDEEGVDCGGSNCAPCATCNDGIQNGNETGVDCGGPDCAPCDNGNCTDVTLTLVLDRYGSETAWNFTDAGGAVIASGSGYPNNQNGLTITETLCLDEGCFNFNITDSYGDGICCAYGQGSYTVTDDNGNILVQGGQFGSSETAPFCIDGGTAPTCNDGIQNGDEEGVDCGGSNCAPCEVEPTCDDGIQNGDEEGVDCGGSNCAPCGNGNCVDVTLTLQLDNYGSETEWNITNSNGQSIGSGGGYSDTQGGGEPIVASGCIDPGCYTFTITDSYGDGICCDYGQGYYEIVDGNGNLLASGGEFGSSESVTFCVGNSFAGGRIATEETAIETPDLEVSNIYPNPVKDVLNIDYQASEGGTVQVTVFDVLGRAVIQQEQDFLAGENQLQLDVNRLQAGYHLVKIQKGETQFTQKFIKD